MRYYDRISVFGTAEQKVEQIVEYLYSLTDILNHNLEGSTPEAVWNATNEALKSNSAAVEDNKEQEVKDGYAALRNLVLKSATNILKVEDSFSYTYTGGFFAESEDGTFSEDGYLNINGTPYNIAQVYKYQSEAISGISDYKRDLEGYIKTGILDKDGENIVFGIDIGYNRNAYYYNGEEFKTEALSKLRITPDRIGFYIENEEISFISKGEIYFPYATIESGSITCSNGSSKVKIGDGQVVCYVDDKEYGRIFSGLEKSIYENEPMMFIMSDYNNSIGIYITSSIDSFYVQYREPIDDNNTRHQFYGGVQFSSPVDVDSFIYSKGYTLVAVNSYGNVLLGSKSRNGHTYIYSGTEKDVKIETKNIYLSASQSIYVPYGIGFMFRETSDGDYFRGIYYGEAGIFTGLHVGIDGKNLILRGTVYFNYGGICVPRGNKFMFQQNIDGEYFEGLYFNNSGLHFGVENKDLLLYGNVKLSSGVAVSSDRRVKNSISSFDDRYEMLFRMLEPKSFRYNSNSAKEHTGFIAQDVEEALEKSGLCDAGVLSKVNKENDVELALVYEEFIALNTYMIQKCLKRINELEEIIKEKVAV